MEKLISEYIQMSETKIWQRYLSLNIFSSNSFYIKEFHKLLQ